MLKTLNRAMVSDNDAIPPICSGTKQFREETLKETLELCASLGTLSQGFTQKRRADVKQVLNAEFKGICSSKEEPSEWLFGDNISEKLKTSKATANLVRFTVRPTYRSPRYSPYGGVARSSLNWKGPSQSRGGWNSRRFPNQRGQPYRSYRWPRQPPTAAAANQQSRPAGAQATPIN